jgi:hypothetical protein
MRIVPVTLEGKHVRLEPLTAQHHAALCAVGLDPAIWTWTAGHVETADGMRDYMLRHAFETWRCLRVALMTDVRNEASRRAILRLGAVQEGVLRNHRITSRGHVRDTVAFSITDREWPDVEARLQRLLAVDSRRPR